MKTKLLASILSAGLLVSATSALAAGDAANGETLAAACAACHGSDGNSATPMFPKLAGLGEKYLAQQLAAIKSGERSVPEMTGLLDNLDAQQLSDLAAFYSAQGGAAAADAPASASTTAAALVEKGACASCHGANFSKPIDGSYPKIAGQHADYLYVALKSYKTEGSPVVGRGNAIMVGQVKQFSLAELKAMAKYIGSLPSEVHTVAQSKFR